MCVSVMYQSLQQFPVGDSVFVCVCANRHQWVRVSPELYANLPVMLPVGFQLLVCYNRGTPCFDVYNRRCLSQVGVHMFGVGVCVYMSPWRVFLGSSVA